VNIVPDPNFIASLSIEEPPDFDVRCLDYIKINKQVCLHVCQNALRGHGERERDRQTYKQTGRQTDREYCIKDKGNRECRESYGR
jgi:hypothetical protein